MSPLFVPPKANQVALQVAGRYLGARPPEPVGPHSQPPTATPTPGEVQVPKVVLAAVAAVQGLSWMAPRIPVPRFWLVTVIRPVPSTATVATYLLLVVDDSHPQAPATGKLDADWKASLTVVRQADAANTTSETLALTV